MSTEDLKVTEETPAGDEPQNFPTETENSEQETEQAIEEHSADSEENTQDMEVTPAFQQYAKKSVQMMRPYMEGEDLAGVAVGEGIIPEAGGMIAMDVENEKDKWYITKEFMDANYILAETVQPGSAEKSLGNTDQDACRKNVSDVVMFGDDLFKLLSKANSVSEGWMKSTKAMSIGHGCVVQVTTQQKNNNGRYVIAEALTYVPGVRIHETKDKDGVVTGRHLKK